MEFNSRLDDKITACGENQKWQSVTPQYLFNFQKFSDFLRAKTQNVHSTALYYGKVQKYEVLTMEIPEELKELNPADQQLFLACGNLDVDKAAEAIRN